MSEIVELAKDLRHIDDSAELAGQLALWVLKNPQSAEPTTAQQGEQ